MKRPRLRPDSAFKHVALDSRAPLKTRMAALAAIIRPSIRFLSRLASDPKIHPKLRLLAAQKLDVRLLIQANLKKEKHEPKS